MNDEDIRYEITHDGKIEIATTSLSSNLDQLVFDLFSQYGWQYTELEKHSAYRKVELKSSTGESIIVNLFTANIRNEKRNPYEKKIQLNREDPRNYREGITLILGFYVFNEDDKIKDAIIVGYPIDPRVNYDTNPSIRGVFVNDILIKAKTNGIYIDKDKKIVGFRPEFIFYYLKNYSEIHDYNNNSNVQATIKFNTGYKSIFSRNRIIFGAPGTGKSHTLNQERKELLGEENENNYERVTFHPDYTYANFVGTYKPVPYVDCDGKESITYEYVPGPFMRIFVEALKNSRTENIKPYLLIIEEINRAKASAVFGDIFQLLDRDDNEVSEYPIQASEDMKKYLAKELGGEPNDFKKIYIPDNMFIWATMNSADQGVFPMDTAFKRRWDFKYLGIDEKEEKIKDKYIILGQGQYKRKVEWNELRKAINNKLASLKINEDKLIGPFFLSKKLLESENNQIDANLFIRSFKGKVLMYLFEDAAKQKRVSLFAEDVDVTKYSSVCEAFDKKGLYVFCNDISSKIIETINEEVTNE